MAELNVTSNILRVNGYQFKTTNENIKFSGGEKVADSSSAKLVDTPSKDFGQILKALFTNFPSSGKTTQVV